MESEDFKIGQRVNFRNHPNMATGNVTAIYTDRMGSRYSVEYLDLKGVVQREYFSGSELVAV